MKKSILIAIDGSACSSFALQYATDIFKGDHEVNFQLVHCTSVSDQTIIEAQDAQNTLLPANNKNEIHAKRGNQYIQKVISKANSLGIDETRFTYSILPTHNVAQAIQLEAQSKVVDAIIVARRGLGYVGEMLFGSVSASLFQKCHNIPLWIIDGEIHHKNILISVDGSPASMLAVDHVAHVFASRTDTHFFLFHCHRFLAPDIKCELEPFYKDWDKEWVNTHLAGQGCLFGGPAQVLLDAGISQEKIIILPQANNIEESMSIISHARKNKCGSIVMGRRRAGLAKGIFGDVATRTILQTQNMALWLIG